MERRDFLKVAGGAGIAAIAGCTSDVGCEYENGESQPSSSMSHGLPDEVVEETEYTPNEHSDCAVYAEDNGVYLTEVEMHDEGERNCYHEVEGTVINANDESVSPHVTVRFFNDDGQVQLELETEYLEIGAGETTELYHEQQMPCFSSHNLAGYDLDVEL